MARIDGASALQSFWHITLPLLRPALVVAILFRAIDAIKTFDIIFIMTQGGPANSSETINILLFNQAFSYFNMGYASSMAVALFAIVMGASLILIKLRRTAAWWSKVGAVRLDGRLLRAGRALHAADGVRLLLDVHAVAEAPGGGHVVSAVVLLVQPGR